MKENVARLGQHVSRRRRELGLSQVDVWRAGGPSNSTLTGIENASVDSVSPSTLRKLDTGLLWEEGSANAVMRGIEPTPIMSFSTTKPLPANVDEIAAGSIAEKLQLLISQAEQLIVDVGESVGTDHDLYRQAQTLHDTAVEVGVHLYGGRDKVWGDAVALIQEVMGGRSIQPDDMGHALSLTLIADLATSGLRASELREKARDFGERARATRIRSADLHIANQVSKNDLPAAAYDPPEESETERARRLQDEAAERGE